jgi:hypothetical protein
MELHMQGAGLGEETTVTSEGEYTEPSFPCQERDGWVVWMGACRRGEIGRPPAELIEKVIRLIFMLGWRNWYTRMA